MTDVPTPRPPLCRECKWMAISQRSYFICTHRAAACLSNDEFETCYHMRHGSKLIATQRTDALCGIEGKLWEPRPPTRKRTFLERLASIMGVRI